MRRRYQVHLLVLAVLLALVPRMALADTFIGTTERGANEGEDKNIAACLACGENYITMDPGLRAALFGSTVDGGEGTTSAPNFPKFAYFRDTCYMNEFTSTMQGRAWSRLNDFTYAWALSDARADLQRALRMWQSDGTQGGGSGGGEGSNTGQIPSRDVTLYGICGTKGLADGPSIVGETRNLYLGGNVFSGFNNGDYKDWLACRLELWSGGSSTGEERFFFSKGDITYSIKELGPGKGGQKTAYSFTVTSTDELLYNDSWSWSNAKAPNNIYTWVSANYDIQGIWLSHDNGMGDDGSGGEFGDDDDDNVFNPTNPPDDTPTKPTSPTQPTVTPTEPSYNVYIDNSNTTTTADLAPILEAIRIINDNLVAGFENVEEAISTCCENMRAFLDAWFAHFSDMIENFSDNVDDWFKWFSEKQYKWLKQIDDDINTTSSQIQSWLQMIYNRMNGGGNTVPNPDTQTDDYFDWWDTFIDKLLNLLPDGVSDFLDVLGGLKEVFPFSVPWDVGLILGVFAADPVTPVFDVSLPTYATSGGWQLVPVHVDLTPWDGVAQLVRSGVLLVFAYYLALWTRDGLRHFEV